MASWITITKAHLADYLVGAQLEALSSAALAEGQSDPFAPAMQDRCNYIRNRLSGRCQVSLTPYAVPPELKGQACMLIVEAMQGRLLLDLTEDQKTMIRRAYSDLDLAGTTEFPVSTPDDPTTSAVQKGEGGIRVVRKPSRRVTRSTMQGL